MKPLDIILIALIAAAFVAAAIYTVRNSKKGCGGNCAECSKRCGGK